ncbi:hypothetical protein F2P81_019366 [Scophthalmus maximus]|uniref:Uncharacterized protein n=1 Tax=Scophthalmus maximus TaxID=52904 RepID=A0A6A4S6W2_SCOMX|nr:hypothetical protein F2P81_019366 [Scophthalmus maximus]
MNSPCLIKSRLEEPGGNVRHRDEGQKLHVNGTFGELKRSELGRDRSYQQEGFRSKQSSSAANRTATGIGVWKR